MVLASVAGKVDYYECFIASHAAFRLWKHGKLGFDIPAQIFACIPRFMVVGTESVMLYTEIPHEIFPVCTVRRSVGVVLREVDGEGNDVAVPAGMEGFEKVHEDPGESGNVHCRRWGRSGRW